MSSLKVYFSKLLWISITLVFLTGCDQISNLPEGDIDNGGLFLPDRFEALVVVDSIGNARHLAVNDNGDIYVKLTSAKQDSGNVAIRDINRDGKGDKIAYFGDYPAEEGYGPTSMRIYNGYIFYSTKDAVYRQKITPGTLVPESKREVVLKYEIYTSHIAKTLAFDDDGNMYVNFGSLTDNCQEEDRTPLSPGQYPCLELAKHAGIWKFDADKINQTQQDGVRYATGLRDGIAMDWNHATNSLFVLEHGRDDMHRIWPSLYSEWESAMLPAEEFLEIKEGANGGWPYYYYDQIQNKRVVSPEYRDVDLEVKVSDVVDPIIGFPGHWAPNDLFFYTGNQFPDRYKNGAFIAFHGGGRRAPYPTGGFIVCFVPYVNGELSKSFEIFADGFIGESYNDGMGPSAYRPMGIAMGPDGSLYIGDSRKGKIWRIMYKGDKDDFSESQLSKMEERKALTHIRNPHEINDNLNYRLADEGQRIYNTYCIACHKADGKGDGNRYPPLAGSDWVTGDKNRLIKAVLEGLEGPITVNGKTYNDLMPKMDFLNDEDIAKVLTYIRMNLNEDVGGVQEREVARVRNGTQGEQH
ncbi:cytochrome c class I [Allomuricauda ruestringensis DSM 13258]|uniref:Cytochrome c class I n=1 Tax=Allomuricauda ruestringensis (strain DSM 13258 / CIP 107369 / LMG 19739 / B1) TaxID=886377 RepID=G2PI97_ALLRU|nr:c-type cytochrome [Allomuricauda ruestringensis]AEM71715.1 cytochrome c class I [Allomuricauda ruestringensis DSM 13258]